MVVGERCYRRLTMPSALDYAELRWWPNVAIFSHAAIYSYV
jgi:hypothetical protein